MYTLKEHISAEAAVYQEVRDQGYTFRSDIDAIDRLDQEFRVIYLPVYVSIWTGAVHIDYYKWDQRFIATLANLDEQPPWLSKTSLLPARSRFPSTRMRCDRLPESTWIDPRYKTTIAFYYPKQLLKISQKYLIITNEEAFNCELRKEGFYQDDEILMKLNSERIQEKSLSNFSHFDDPYLWSWMGHKPCYNCCMISDPSIIR